MARSVDQDRRDQIARDALQVLRDRGLQQCSMSELAKALGLKRPTLYFYFPGIADIFAHLLAQLRNDEVRFVGARLAGRDHPLDVLDAFLRAELAFYRERGLQDFMILMAQFWASGAEAERERFRMLATRELVAVRALFVALLHEGVARGRVAPCDPETLVELVLVLLDGLLIQVGLRDIDPDPLVDLVKHRVLDPLRLETP